MNADDDCTCWDYENPHPSEHVGYCPLAQVPDRAPYSPRPICRACGARTADPDRLCGLCRDELRLDVPDRWTVGQVLSHLFDGLRACAPRCGNPACPGWVLDISGRVERCDDCALFRDDDEARTASGRCEICGENPATILVGGGAAAEFEVCSACFADSETDIG